MVPTENLGTTSAISEILPVKSVISNHLIYNGFNGQTLIAEVVSRFAVGAIEKVEIVAFQR